MGLSVDPDDLVLFDARTFVKVEATYKTSLCYAIDAADVRGTPEPREEIIDARYWRVEEFETSAATLGTALPEAHRELRWWVEEGRAALNTTDRRLYPGEFNRYIRHAAAARNEEWSSNHAEQVKPASPDSHSLPRRIVGIPFVDPYRRNSGPLDARDLDDVTGDLNAVARFRRAVEVFEYQSTDRFDLLTLEVPGEGVSDFRQLDSAVDVVPPIVARAY